ncbi:MAG: DNA-directed RNA polymerase subunit omega [Acidobacteriota bacterium]
MIKPVEKALTKIPNRFLLTTVVARRWENITAGAPPLVETRKGSSRIAAVLEEVVQDRVHVNSESREIVLAGLPEVEVNEEPIYTEPFQPEPEKAERPRKGER